MSLSIVSGARNHLVNQLVFFDENLPFFFDTYFPEPTSERDIINQHIQQYRRTLETILQQEDSAMAETLKTIALLGSSVKIYYYSDESTETFTVVYPTEADPEHNKISFLSPIGRRLFLRSPGDILTLETPISKYHVRIEDIKLTLMSGFAAGRGGLYDSV